MEEYLFAAFISEGKVRIGRTNTLAMRIALLRSELNAYGADIRTLLITSPIEDADKLEQDLLGIMAMRFDKVSRKTFYYCNKEDVSEVFHDLRLQFMHVQDVKTLKVGKSHHICAVLNYQDHDDIEFAKTNRNKDFSESILSILRKAGGTVTHGVLQNKIREADEDALEESVKRLLDADLITRRSFIHKYNKKRIREYKLRT